MGPVSSVRSTSDLGPAGTSRDGVLERRVPYAVAFHGTVAVFSFLVQYTISRRVTWYLNWVATIYFCFAGQVVLVNKGAGVSSGTLPLSFNLS